MSLHRLDLTGRPVLLLGGGPGAERRCRELLDEGARVRVVAAHACEGLRDLAEQHSTVTWERRDVVRADLTDVWLVSIQDADAARDAAVREWCAADRIWCEGVDARAVESVDVDGYAVAVDGPRPDLAQQVRSRLVTALQEGEVALPPRRAGEGRVVLVGGGPGSPDLLTLRARRELARADVVVTDRLAPTDVLRELAHEVEVVDVGKTPYHHPIPQPEINRILVERAQRGQYVVRLKGGDPFVLGRGGEELLACREAGVEVDVVPGVTSALAAPAAANIPVTHRGTATGFLVVSGHDELETSVLAQWPGTILVLMGMSRLHELTSRLLRDGRDPQTAAAVVHRAWTPRQRVVRGTLADIAERVTAAGVANPSVIVIGDVATVLDEA
ncbi:uroporphyrinogen-III C-methyltransferase [Luteipulveratus sp. YIM 133132]|uniref:uroporphyrinogen-III C-methyltransferase n=1 Tax=Luteipulveratus flavus TaxID=3031728 RepID=UPI0023B09927|nr:uroporphyrinogen-III C-methyltransferase [Luteipulveratus sp. YIM 133132]MDE9365560.1 uroporphyrinogen-III C-methyltransferase [Luteipulveratus sp. YIM 133132]